MAGNVGINSNQRNEARSNSNTNVNTNSGSSSSGFHGSGGSRVGVGQVVQPSSGSSAVSGGGGVSGGTVGGGSYGGASYGGGVSDSAAAAAAAEAAAAAAAEAAAAAAAERQRQMEEARRKAVNEQKRRDNDARAAREQQEREQERAEQRQQKSQQAASIDPRQQARRQQAEAQRRRNEEASGNRQVPTVSADDVAVAGSEQEMEQPSQPTRSENLGFVDTETGELVNTTPERATAPAPRTANGRPGRNSQPAQSTTPSRIAEMVEESMEQRADDQRAGGRHAMRGKHFRQTESNYATSGHRVSAQDMQEAQAAYVNEMTAEQVAEQKEQEGQEEEEDVLTDASSQDIPWSMWQNMDGVKKNESALRKQIVENEDRRHSRSYKEYVGGSGQENTNFEAYERGGAAEFDFDADMDEHGVARMLQKLQDVMYRRFINPTLIRIENERVERRVVKEGRKEITQARLRYSDRVEGAINAVRRMYNCSIYNAMQLIQLRAGLGVDVKGKIGNVNPDEFRLTEDQVVELCRDICKSQAENGHPLGLVNGSPGGNGVRDDTGRFVVVSGTRCFPVGYMPKQLIMDLRRDEKSVLHEMSVPQIDQLVGTQWMNETYPILCANTGGNLMYQARAIENMMRALMRVDGVDPGKRNIPEVVERETLLALRAEAASATDPAIKEAIELRQQADEDSLSRWRHRRMKKNGVRQDGSIKSVSEAGWARRLEQSLTTFGNVQRFAGATRVAIMISSVPETIMAEGGMSVANMMADAWRNRNPEIAENYQFTDQLRSMAESREAVEARAVAESLYRVGGLDAMRAFLSELGDDGRRKYRLTNADLRTFLQEYGFMNGGERARRFVKPGQEAAFRMNVQHVIDTLDNVALSSSSLFKTREARQFVQMSMSEMGQASLHGRESYDTAQVTDWGLRGGGEELVRSLLQTDAGIEAFMTQGITSLGRKSPVEHQMRVALGKNGFCEFMVRNLFDRYIEYGVNKFMSQIPMSNTVSYLISRRINKVGDFIAANTENAPLGSMAAAMQRNYDYQVGSRLSFKEGLLKNLRYDMVMAGGQLGKAFVVYGILNHLGGIYPPDDERDKYTLSEWTIGTGEGALPIKFAWWMDDMAGTGLPLGFALAICQQGGWDPAAIDMAAKCFTNQVANFNDGTAVFDAIELVMNPEDHINKFLGLNVEGYNPSFGEWANSFVEQKFWDLVGSVTPAAIGELVPWSKDYLFKGDADAHTPYRVYDAGGQYTMEEAQAEYRTKDVGYAEVMRRRSSQTNVLQALFYDFWNGANDTSYKYAEMPLDTMTDPMAQRTYDMFKLDLDSLPLDQDERIDLLRGNGMAVIDYVDSNFQNAAQANAGAFVLDYAARKNAEYWCRQMIREARQDFEDVLKNGRLPNDEYYTLKQERDDKIDHYYWLIDEFFNNDDIPWRVPRYVRQESDYETRYVDEEGNPMTFLDTLAGNAKAERYLYGNVPSLSPVSSPRSEGKGRNFETIPYWAVLDDEGNPVSDLATMYDLAGQMGPIEEGRNAGKSVQNLMWGGQGTNMYGSGEELAIERGGIPTLGGGSWNSGGRPWRVMEDFLPESMKNMDPAELLGLPPLDEEEEEEAAASSSGSSGGYGGYGGSYYPRYYGGGGGYYYGGYSSYSGSGSPQYNPKIYSNPRQVYSTRAAGLNVRTPYKATNTYLRPAFYTKGSREAYRRQDI